MFPRVHVMFSSYALIFCDSFLLCYRNWSISEVYRLYSLDRKKVMAGIELNKKIARSWHLLPRTNDDLSLTSQAVKQKPSFFICNACR